MITVNTGRGARGRGCGAGSHAGLTVAEYGADKMPGKIRGRHVKHSREKEKKKTDKEIYPKQKAFWIGRKGGRDGK